MRIVPFLIAVATIYYMDTMLGLYKTFFESHISSAKKAYYIQLTCEISPICMQLDTFEDLKPFVKSTSQQINEVVSRMIYMHYCFEEYQNWIWGVLCIFPMLWICNQRVSQTVGPRYATKEESTHIAELVCTMSVIVNVVSVSWIVWVLKQIAASENTFGSDIGTIVIPHLLLCFLVLYLISTFYKCLFKLIHPGNHFCICETNFWYVHVVYAHDHDVSVHLGF